jgi:hypothetical protein
MIMITLDYSLDPSEIPAVNGADLASATHTDLDYYLFCGSVVFRIDGKSFDAQWGWIPILDFATQLFLIVCEIKDAEVRTLEFTESEATIEFRRQGSEIQVSAEYASATAEAPLQELKQTASAFFRKVLDDVSSRWPQITDSPFFRERGELLKTRCVD